jgi:hypothetical protein
MGGGEPPPVGSQGSRTFATGDLGTEPSQDEKPAAPPVEAAPAPMTPEDAAENFKTVVESFVAKNSRAGAWEYEEKGKITPLVLISVQAGGLRKSGSERYSGDASFRDAATKRARRLEFTVDFSGANWKVVRVRPVKAPR